MQNESLSADDSLATLVADLDDSFWNAAPTPDASPVKPKKLFHAGIPANNVDVDVSWMLQGMEPWDLDGALSEPPSPEKSKKKLQPRLKRVECTRCTVECIDEDYSNGQYQKVLTTLAEQGPCTIILRDDWIETDVNVDDTIHVIGSFTQQDPSTAPSITITSKDNFIILHPDLLVTITAVSTASQCRRKPLLTGLVRSSTDYTPALVWGNMLHEVMQTCLSEDKWDTQYIDEQIELVISKGLMDLVRIDTPIIEARRELRERSRGLQPFAAKYISKVPKPEAVLTNTRDTTADTPSLLAIADILDIEEDIWSPTYGLRGKLDVTVFAHTASASTQPSIRTFFNSQSQNTNKGSRSNFFNTTSSVPSSTVGNLKSNPTPFEIKTGRANAGTEHRAQTMLYTLLAEERYGSDVPAGLLYYTQSEEVVRVPRSRNEVRALVMTRNELAFWMMKRIRAGEGECSNEDIDTQRTIVMEGSFLPPTVDNERSCKRCYVVDTCMLYRKAVEGVVDSNSPIADIYASKTSHLTPSHCDFFKKWEALLTYEERDLIRFKRELWTLRAEEREKKGRCFAGMLLEGEYDPSHDSVDYSLLSRPDTRVGVTAVDSVAALAAVNNEKIHRKTYRFKRSPEHGRNSSSDPSSFHLAEQESLLNGHINVGDAITISVEPHLLALVRGFVLKLTATDIIVGVDHDLSPESVKAKLSHTGNQQDEDKDTGPIVFRIDRDELFGGVSRMRNNLAQLFYVDDEDGRNKRLRELLVDLTMPLFHVDVPEEAKTLLNGLVVETGSAADASEAKLVPQAMKDETIWGLNPTQTYAVKRILSAQDYALVLGMPGTGKTTVIAALICALVQLGKTVLLTSYTHSAVDTILLKLDAMGNMSGGTMKGMCDFGVLRLGNADKVHPQVRKYTLAARTRAQTIEQLEGQLMTPPVVATTCLSIDHALFNRRTFDYCIVDEASQITLPTCLGPLRFADTFVLVGDHFQLPPLVRNPLAREGGLDVSLFRRLSDAHPEAVVELSHQYRMNEDIMLLSNKLVYGDRLVCGNRKVARQWLDIADWSFVNGLHGRREQGCLAQFELEQYGVSEDGACWLKRLLMPRTKAVFVDTDFVPARDSRVGDLVQNTVEAQLVYYTVETLLRSGVKEDQIGIISLYRQQIKLISQLLRHRTGIEMLTADKSQGRDKDCIIISMVRSNDAGHTGDLVKDWRRMNVSFTRARRKLIIFGSRSTLKAVDLLSEFFQLMEGKGWILQLPSGSETIHRHAFAGTNDGGSADVKKDQHLPRASQPSAFPSNKRAVEADDDVCCLGYQENVSPSKDRPRKKTKTVGNSGVVRANRSTAAGILKGRPILQDLVNEEV